VSFLIDTKVISEMYKGRSRNHGVAAWYASIDRNAVWLSVLVVGEIRRGVEMLRKRDPARALSYNDWLAGLAKTYESRILPIDDAVADIWGRISATRSIPTTDALLAATALSRNLVLVTRNERDVAGTGVRTLNPFSR
jgi:predicted nucleic acid-binding protein